MMSLENFGLTNSICDTWLPSHKRPRLGQDVGIPQQKGTTSKYKGAEWGAQIYKEHHQGRLGTFRSELQDKTFQRKYSEQDVQEMIKNGSYTPKCAAFQSEYQRQRLNSNLIVIHDGEYCARQLLFQKTLTASDVGRLSRFVIPKKHAIDYFPAIDSNVSARKQGCVLYIDIYDAQKDLWTFRYCRWNSSQSYVFTGGWNKFVKKNGLKADDIVYFYMNDSPEGKFFGIEIDYVGVRNTDGTITPNLNNPEGIKDYEVVNIKEENELSIASSNVKEREFMLFGVRIKSAPVLSPAHEDGRSNVAGIIGEDGDYLAQNANYQEVKIKREEFQGLKVDQ